MTLEFIKRDPDSLYQNIMIELGSTTKMDYPSSRTVRAIELLVNKINELENEIKELKNGKINTEVGPL
jgi:hypothetical protein